MEVVAKGTVLCGNVRALVRRFKPEIFTRKSLTFRLMRTQSFVAKNTFHLFMEDILIEEIESVCRKQYTSGGFNQKY